MDTQSHTPVVSVILPVYNAEKFIRESVASVLGQTLQNFELIIIDDGSSDKSSAIINEFNDPRIVFVQQENMGLAATLNRGIGLAKADLIARQDNDDISLPTRLEKQYAFMQANPSVAIVGARAEIIDENGNELKRYHDHPEKHLKFELLFNNPFVHSAVMFRKNVVASIGNYHTGKEVFEDYNLWSRIARVATVANIPERLIKYREVHSGMSRTTRDYDERVIFQSARNMEYYLGPGSFEKALQLATFITDPRRIESVAQYHTVRRSMKELVDAFLNKENLPGAEIREEALKKMVDFDYRYFSSLINGSSRGVVMSLYARIKRKLLFLKYKKYLTA